MKKNEAVNIPVIFLIGAPRSGTTAVSEFIGEHSDVTQWYEPYFIWEGRLGSGKNDVRASGHASDEVKQYLRSEFRIFLKNSEKGFILEKSPENCLRIPFLKTVFPEAKWIHLIRDGRDTILSMNKSWSARKKMVEQRDLRALYGVVLEALSLQPFLRNKLQLIWFEFYQHFRAGFRTIMNKSHWEGNVGWGPRFPGWKESLFEVSDLEFNAIQWKHCLEFSIRDMKDIPASHIHTIRYENMNDDPVGELQKVFSFIGVDQQEAEKIAPSFYKGNYGKWQKAFSHEEKKAILPHIQDLLVDFGYSRDDSWTNN